MGDPDTFRMAIPGQQFRVQARVAKEAFAYHPKARYAILPRETRFR